MSNWVNFREIRQKVSLEEVIFTYYKLDGFKRSGSKLVGPCPIHGGDSPRAFHAELDRNVWHCFSQCSRGGNQLDFVSLKEGISIRDAALRLQAFFLSDTNRSPPPATTTGPKRTPGNGSSLRAPARPAPERNPPLDMNLSLRSDHPHLVEDRGLSEQTCEMFGVGYCSRGIMRGCIAVPVQDEDGALVAYAGRRLKPQSIREYGKYKFPKGFRKELVLYNFHRVRDVARSQGLILVEGFFSVLKLSELGFENVVAVMGCALSEFQADLLTDVSDVIVLFDANDAGRAGARAAKELLDARDVVVRVGSLPDGLEPEDLEPRALRWLIRGLQQLDLSSVSMALRPTSEP